MELSKVLTPDRILVPIPGGDKTAVITALMDVLGASGSLSNPRAALEAVLRREAERSTGIGYGLAIPHGKCEGCRTLLMACGKPAAPIDFQSVDGRPVTFVVLLVSSPEQTGPHIQALAKISRLMNMEAFRSAVNDARSAEELHQAIVTFEAREGTAA